MGASAERLSIACFTSSGVSRIRRISITAHLQLSERITPPHHAGRGGAPYVPPAFTALAVSPRANGRTRTPYDTNEDAPAGSDVPSLWPMKWISPPAPYCLAPPGSSLHCLQEGTPSCSSQQGLNDLSYMWIRLYRCLNSSQECCFVICIARFKLNILGSGFERSWIVSEGVLCFILEQEQPASCSLRLTF